MMARAKFIVFIATTKVILMDITITSSAQDWDKKSDENFKDTSGNTLFLALQMSHKMLQNFGVKFGDTLKVAS